MLSAITSATEAAAAVRSLWGVEGTASRLAGHGDNYRIDAAAGARYVLKLAAPEEDPAHLHLQHTAAAALAEALPGVGVPRAVRTLDGRPMLAFGQPARLGHLLAWVDGTPWQEAAPAAMDRLRDLGALAARMARALAGVDHPAARITHAWDLARADVHRQALGAVGDPDHRRLADLAFERFAAAAPDLVTVPHGLIHGDLNDENLLVEGGRIVGLLDLGDALWNPLVCELAIALAYVLLDRPDPWEAGAAVVAGYHAERPLTPTEVELLYPLLCARLAVSVVISAGRRTAPGARDSFFTTEERAWAFLERFGDGDPVVVADALAARIDVAPWPDRGPDPDALRERRATYVSSALSLTYREPVAFARGRGTYLLDQRGRPFLDLYNNVAHVGHCHPRVVEAGQRQMGRLNTNTRYLVEAHVAYVEKLAATFPPELSTVFLVNSGTEANELALRLARVHTGRREVVVLDCAYHGHTGGLIDVSPYKFMGPGGSGRPERWVHVAPQPDGFRGPFRGHDAQTGRAYGDAVGEAVARAEEGVAAFLAETLPSVGGQIIPPPGYLETAFAHVRAAGGVCILDEVQVGLGRVGSAFWAFEDYGVTPDVVVLGKPLGNGHPMGAVVCTREVAASFEAAGMEFFSTFGGNPVSCAIGAEVLDVVAEEGLQAHAMDVGGYLLNSLRELAGRHPAIGDVRGRGLFLGIDLVEEDGLTPATPLAADVVNGLRQRRILTGTDGPGENVIKLKGPLVVRREDVDRFVEELDEVLAERTSGRG